MTEDGMHFCSADAGFIGSFLVTTLGPGLAFLSLSRWKCVMRNLLQAFNSDEQLNAKRGPLQQGPTYDL